MWLKFLSGRERNQIETHGLRRSQILDNEFAMIKALDMYRTMVRFSKRFSVNLGNSLVKLENEITKDVTNTSLLLMCFHSICAAVTVKELCNSHIGNKSLYKNIRALDKKVFGVDIASSQLWLATFEFQYKDYLMTLQTVNNVLSSIPLCALYYDGRHIHIDYPSAYSEMCDMSLAL